MVILPHHLSISKGGSPAARGYTRAREQGIHGVSSGASPGVRFLGLPGSDSEHGLGSGIHRAASPRYEKRSVGLLPRPGDDRSAAIGGRARGHRGRPQRAHGSRLVKAPPEWRDESSPQRSGGRGAPLAQGERLSAPDAPGKVGAHPALRSISARSLAPVAAPILSATAQVAEEAVLPARLGRTRL